MKYSSPILTGLGIALLTFITGLLFGETITISTVGGIVLGLTSGMLVLLDKLVDWQ